MSDAVLGAVILLAVVVAEEADSEVSVGGRVAGQRSVHSRISTGWKLPGI